MSDDRLLGDEIVGVDSDHGGTGLGEITNVKGGKLDAVETEKASQDSAITDVESRDEPGKVGSKLRLTVRSSVESLSLSGEDKVIGVWKELGVLLFETSVELSSEVGVGGARWPELKLAVANSESGLAMEGANSEDVVDAWDD